MRYITDSSSQPNQRARESQAQTNKLLEFQKFKQSLNAAKKQYHISEMPRGTLDFQFSF